MKFPAASGRGIKKHNKNFGAAGCNIVKVVYSAVLFLICGDYYAKKTFIRRTGKTGKGPKKIGF
jgi:hypothetical protein